MAGTDKIATVSEAMIKDWFTKEEFADKLQVEMNNLNQILYAGPKNKMFRKPGKLDKQTIKNRAFFSPEYVELVIKARENIKPRGKASVSSLKHVKMSMTVNIFDPKAAEFYKKKFGGEEGVTKFLQGKLDELYKPTLQKLKELEDEFERRKREIMGE